MIDAVSSTSINLPVVNAVEHAFVGAFDEERIQTLLGYGSVIDKGHGTAGRSDVDIYLMLDTYQREDITKTQGAAVQLGGVPVDLTLHYKDELPSNPANFTLGTKSCLALAYLASAHTIFGSNPFVEMYAKLDDSALRHSALDAIVHHLSRMRTEITSPPNLEKANARIDKYMARILIDAIIFFDKVTYEPFKCKTTEEIIDMAAEHPNLCEPIGPHINNAKQGDQTSKLALMQATCTSVKKSYDALKKL